MKNEKSIKDINGDLLERKRRITKINIFRKRYKTFDGSSGISSIKKKISSLAIRAEEWHRTRQSQLEMRCLQVLHEIEFASDLEDISLYVMQYNRIRIFCFSYIKQSEQFYYFISWSIRYLYIVVCGYTNEG